MQLLSGLVGLRSAYDFEAPDLTVRGRLARLEYAAWQALQQSSDPGAREELGYTLTECRALLQMGVLEGELAEREGVPQRLRRIQRVVTYREGSLVRLNRQYWWVPFSMALLLMAAGWVRSLGL